MADPLTLTVVGAVALTEGVKFLYAQAGEALKARRDARKSKSVQVEVEVEIDPPNVFAQAPRRARLDLGAVGRLERELREFRSAFAEVHAGLDEIDENDPVTLGRIEGLRRVLGAVYQQPFVFRGEPAPTANGEVDVDEVLGYVAGLRARRVIGGSVTGTVRAGRVEGGARVVGVEIDEFG